jgi:lipopolysaccharide transport system permease protein
MSSILIHLRALVRHHELVEGLVLRTLKARYKQSVLGVGLAVIQPLLMMVVFSLAFRRLVSVPHSGVPYSLYVFCGLLPWNLLAVSLATAVPSVVGNAHLMSKVYFPREVFPIAETLANVVDFGIGLALLLAFGLWCGIPLTVALLAIPLLLAIQVVLIIGISLLLSALNVFYRDVRAMLPLATMLWLFLTPVVYPPSAFPERYAFLLALNPMAPIVQAYRAVILDGRLPPAGELAYAAAFATACLIGSYLLFKRFEPAFVEVA